MLITYLSTRVTVLPFDSLSTLMDNTNFKITTHLDTSLENKFRFATNPLWQKAWKERMEPYRDELKPLHGMCFMVKVKVEIWSLKVL